MRHIGENTDSRDGFTLIELILSLGLLSLVLTTAFILYSSGQKSYDSENAKIFDSQNIRQAFLWLSTSIKQAKTIESISENEIKIINSSGEKIIYYFSNGMLYRKKNNGVNPVAELGQASFSRSGKYSVEIFLKAKNSNYALTTKLTPFGLWVN